MTLNLALEPILAAFADFAGADWSTLPVAAVRAMMDNPMTADEPLPMERIADIVMPLAGRNIAGRLYVPPKAGNAPPLTVYFHGGGWVLGSLDTHDAACRELAGASGSAVFSVDYRLAPEARYPAAAEDCYEACLWAVANAGTLGIDGARVAIAGDSAGGNLAGAVAVMMRDRGGPALRHQLLIYPVTDAAFDNDSHRANGGGNYFLSTAAMQWFWGHYLGDTSPADAPLAALLRQPDLSGLAPATVITAQYDPLRDEGNAYAKRLAEQGVPTDHAEAPGMIHGFFGMTAMVPDARQWVKRAGTNLARSFE